MLQRIGSRFYLPGLGLQREKSKKIIKLPRVCNGLKLVKILFLRTSGKEYAQMLWILQPTPPPPPPPPPPPTPTPTPLYKGYSILKNEKISKIPSFFRGLEFYNENVRMKNLKLKFSKQLDQYFLLASEHICDSKFVSFWRWPPMTYLALLKSRFALFEFEGIQGKLRISVFRRLLDVVTAFPIWNTQKMGGGFFSIILENLEKSEIKLIICGLEQTKMCPLKPHWRKNSSWYQSGIFHQMHLLKIEKIEG